MKRNECSPRPIQRCRSFVVAFSNFRLGRLCHSLSSRDALLGDTVAVRRGCDRLDRFRGAAARMALVAPLVTYLRALQGLNSFQAHGRFLAVPNASHDLGN